MTNNDTFDSFLDELDEIGRRLQTAAKGSPDSTRPDFEQSTPETPRDAARANRSLDDDKNFSKNNFSEEQQVGSPPEDPFTTQICRSFLDVLFPHSDVPSQKGYSESSEDNPDNCILIPVEATLGDFDRTDANQSNPPEYLSSSQQTSKYIDSRSTPHEERTHSNPVTGESGSRKNKNEMTEFFRKRKQFHSISTPQISIQMDGNDAKEQKLEHRREIANASADVNEMNDSSKLVALGSVVDAEGVLAAGPSGTQKKSCRTGKIKNFVCGFCGKAFNKRQNLEAHERTHTGERPFACSMCDKSFTQQCTLTRHLLTHTRDKTFACEFCERRFARNDNLQVHLLTHTGEKPFECDECERKFSQLCHYRRHLKGVHGRK